jgi:16S rRNA (guanine527-N7)-methyltransferase
MDQILTEGIAQLCTADHDTALLIEPRVPVITEKLSRYIDEIERFNPAYGLVKVESREELIVKHILDSLAALGCIVRLLRSFAPATGAGKPMLADVGSGAGLPGIPLAICLADVQITLIERMGRRIGFLRNTLPLLGLTNVTVEETAAEKAAPGRFHGIVFRAFHPLDPALLKSLFRLLVPGGFLAAYKGRREKTEAEMASAGLREIRNTGDTAGTVGTWEDIPLAVPFLNEERRLTVLFRGAL